MLRFGVLDPMEVSMKLLVVLHVIMLLNHSRGLVLAYCAWTWKEKKQDLVLNNILNEVNCLVVCKTVLQTCIKLAKMISTKLKCYIVIGWRKVHRVFVKHDLESCPNKLMFLIRRSMPSFSNDSFARARYLCTFVAVSWELTSKIARLGTATSVVPIYSCFGVYSHVRPRYNYKWVLPTSRFWDGQFFTLALNWQQRTRKDT